MTTWRNWGGNVTANPRRIEASSNAQIADLVAAAADRGERVKPIGSSHSFTRIGEPVDIQLGMRSMNQVLSVDAETQRVRVQAGMTLRELNAYLDTIGLALPNMGDVDPQTVSGAVSTSTHGTGGKLFGIAAAVVGIRLITATGDILDIDENHPYFGAARVTLGALGVVTEVEFQCVPAFLLNAREEPFDLGDVLGDLDSLINDNDHFEFYWWPHTAGTQIKRNNRVPDGTPADPVGKIRHFVDDEILANGAFELMCRLGKARRSLVPRINRLAANTLSAREYTDTSHKVFVSRRRVRFKETEFALPREAALSAIEEVRAYVDSHDETIGFPLEVRFTGADDVWLSTSTGRDSVYIAAHVYHRYDHERYFAGLEKIFIAHQGRPHWGKLHTRNADYLRTVYPRFDDFIAIRNELDPGRVFTNPYLDQVLGP